MPEVPSGSLLSSSPKCSSSPLMTPSFLVCRSHWLSSLAAICASGELHYALAVPGLSGTPSAPGIRMWALM